MKAVIIITLSIFLSCAGLEIQANDYKSAADLYPKQAETAGLLQLGGIEELDGDLCRTMGECKSVINDSWFQFYDVAENGDFDNEADFAIFFMLYENEFVVLGLYTPEQAIEIITDHCKKHDVETQGFIHFADPVKIRKDNEI